MELSPELFTKELLSREELDELTDLGYLFEKGIYFKRDYKMAHKIYERCASFGFGRALNNLGWLYQNGLGVKEEAKLSFSEEELIKEFGKIAEIE